MKKLLAVVFSVAGLTAMLIAPGPVAGSNGQNDRCPNGFSPISVTIGIYPDKNRNGWICRKFQHNGVTYKDDNAQFAP